MASLDLDRSLDTQRERALIELRDLYARGELTLTDFSERLDRVFAATTSAELRASWPVPVGEAETLTWSGLPRADLESLVQRLDDDEILCWVGRPDPTALLTRKDAYLIPFSIVWTMVVGLGVFKVLGVAGGGWILGLPMLLFGLYMMIGRFVYKAWRKRHMIYAVTDRRALILTRGRNTDRVDATYLDAIPAISTATSGSGAGSVHLGIPDRRGADYANTGLDFARRASDHDHLGFSFFDIPNADGVADLIRTLRAHRSAIVG